MGILRDLTEKILFLFCITKEIRKFRYDDRFHTGREFLYIFRVDMRYLSLPMNSLVCTPYDT